MLNNKFSFPVYRSLHAVLHAQVPTSSNGRYDPHVLALTPFSYLRDLEPSIFVYRAAYLVSMVVADVLFLLGTPSGVC